MEISKDSVVNVIYQGIKYPIELCVSNGALRAALVLMYAGIDVLAKLGLPEEREVSSGDDYIIWCDKYLKFTGKDTIVGLEWFAARCGLLHNYTAESNLSKKGKVRMIGYYTGEGPDIKFAPEESKTLVMVRAESLFEVFYKALDIFVDDLHVHVGKEIIEKRFKTMLHDLEWRD